MIKAASRENRAMNDEIAYMGTINMILMTILEGYESTILERQERRGNTFADVVSGTAPALTVAFFVLSDFEAIVLGGLLL